MEDGWRWERSFRAISGTAQLYCTTNTIIHEIDDTTKKQPHTIERSRPKNIPLDSYSYNCLLPVNPRSSSTSRWMSHHILIAAK